MTTIRQSASTEYYDTSIKFACSKVISRIYVLVRKIQFAFLPVTIKIIVVKYFLITLQFTVKKTNFSGLIKVQRHDFVTRNNLIDIYQFFLLGGGDLLSSFRRYALKMEAVGSY
jgi:hypothetical protein